MLDSWKLSAESLAVDSVLSRMNSAEPIKRLPALIKLGWRGTEQSLTYKFPLAQYVNPPIQYRVSAIMCHRRSSGLSGHSEQKEDTSRPDLHFVPYFVMTNPDLYTTAQLLATAVERLLSRQSRKRGA